MRGRRLGRVTNRYMTTSSEHSEHLPEGTRNPALPFCGCERCGAVRHGPRRFTDARPGYS